tara:strand:- start:366 stop:1646 length:1281 start_codon:yes stop_codon:yes gene_type:complete
MNKITDLSTYDIRFPTSQSLDGSDAMNSDPDYSASYLILHTNYNNEGHGLSFTIGRGNEICIKAIEAMKPLIVGLEVEWIKNNLGEFWKKITRDSQLRWIGPEKGAIHLATSAIVNAVWDLLAKEEEKPVWQFVSEMSSEKLLSIIDFRYITNVISPREALLILKQLERSKFERIEKLKIEGYPSYTTSAGWLGYSDEKLKKLCQEIKKSGFNHAKFKVGKNIDDDIRRMKIVREELGNDFNIMIDANQVWEVDEAINWIKKLSFSKPLFIEEPTSPDDIIGHKIIRENIKPIKVASGEMCQNRIMFKQFISEKAIDIVQIDACRLGGLNEVLSVLLMAKKFNLPVWPHAGGVGLCEYVQHLSMIDYIVISGEKDTKRIEYVDHLHEHFINPCILKQGAYMPPNNPGFSIQMKKKSINKWQFKVKK